MDFDYAVAGHIDLSVDKRRGTYARACRAGWLPDDVWEMLKWAGAFLKDFSN